MGYVVNIKVLFMSHNSWRNVINVKPVEMLYTVNTWGSDVHITSRRWCMKPWLEGTLDSNLDAGSLNLGHDLSLLFAPVH